MRRMVDADGSSSISYPELLRAFRKHKVCVCVCVITVVSVEVLSGRGKWIVCLFFSLSFLFFLLCFLLERYAQTFFQGENIGEEKKKKKRKTSIYLGLTVL